MTERTSDKDLLSHCKKWLIENGWSFPAHGSKAVDHVADQEAVQLAQFVERELAELRFETQHLLAVCAELRNANLAAEAAAFEKAAQVIEECNHTGPYQAIGGARFIRELISPDAASALEEVKRKAYLDGRESIMKIIDEHFLAYLKQRGVELSAATEKGS